jgi:hypothetical protein
MPTAAVLEPRTDPLAERLDATGWPILPPTLLTIHRTSNRDEQSRQIVCRLEDEWRFELMFGQTLTREIAPGSHTLKVHNTLQWKRVAFEAFPGTHTHFTVWNRAGRGYYWLITFVGVAPLWLEVAPGTPESLPQRAAPSHSPSLGEGLWGVVGWSRRFTSGSRRE